MTFVGHVLTGTAIGLAAMPDYPSKRQKTIHLLVFALLATVPDWPIRNWGHNTYYFSHSLFTNLLLIGLTWIFLFIFPRLWEKYRSTSAAWVVSPQLMFAGTVAWLSHLLLDTFYNHGKGLAMFWPFSDTRLALPIPWLAVASRPFLPVSVGNLRILLVELLTFFPLVVLAILFHKAGFLQRLKLWQHQAN
jgi:membrane-bound metal-dependent hydrolase YbcI (DUF457 family)